MPRTVTRRRADIDKPRGRKRVEAIEPDDDQYEPDDEQEERPRRGRTSSRPARSRRDEDEDERPSRSARVKSKGKRSKRGPEKPSKPRGGKGWSGYKEQRSKSASFNSENELRVPEKKTLTVKFLEPYPFFTYNEHWINNRPKGEKKSFFCGEDDCPLCDVGHDEKRVFALFNVVDLSDGVSKYLVAGPNLADAIGDQADSEDLELDDMDDYDEEENPAPIINQPGLYFSISKKKGGNGFFDHTVTPVWEERLKSDPLTDEEEDEALENLFEEDVVYQDKKSVLRDVADEYLESGD